MTSYVTSVTARDTGMGKTVTKLISAKASKSVYGQNHEGATMSICLNTADCIFSYWFQIELIERTLVNAAS